MSEEYVKVAPVALDALIVELNDLRARLAAVDAMHEASAASAREFWQRAEAAEARLAAVEAIVEYQLRAALRGEDTSAGA